MFEESLCLLLRASWFDPLVEESEKSIDYFNYDDDDDEEEDLDEIEFYSGRFSSLRFGNHRWVDNEYVSAERQEARPIQDSGAGPSHQPKKKESPAEELVGRRAKRALKREAADKADDEAAVAKHQLHLARLGRMQTRLQ